MDYQITSLFPTPLYHARLGRDFTSQEKKFVEIESQSAYENSGNMIGSSVEVLNEPSLKKIKKFIQAHVDQYFDTICAPSSDVRAYLTQSWLNYTFPGQTHHIHAHDNSFISGVLYINANREEDAITFVLSTRRDPLYLTSERYNIYNNYSSRVSVHTGDLLIFPSSLTHRVDEAPTNRTMTRISLAFNTFLRGEIGNRMNRMHLVLK